MRVCVFEKEREREYVCTCAYHKNTVIIVHTIICSISFHSNFDHNVTSKNVHALSLTLIPLAMFVIFRWTAKSRSTFSSVFFSPLLLFCASHLVLFCFVLFLIFVLFI